MKLNKFRLHIDGVRLLFTFRLIRKLSLLNVDPAFLSQKSVHTYNIQFLVHLRLSSISIYSVEIMNECIVPAPRSSDDNRWINQHDRQVHECREAEPEVLLIGDSIIQKLIYCDDIWSKLSSLHPLNLGIGGDRTQNVLWRILNGAIDQTHPGVILLHVGTNNNGNNSQQISEGILKIVDELQRIFPITDIVVWGLLPRGECPNSVRRRNDEVNEILQKHLVGRPFVEIICTGDCIIQPDGQISDKDLYDYLHLTSQGYVKVFGPVLEKLQTILNSLG